MPAPKDPIKYKQWKENLSKSLRGRFTGKDRWSYKSLKEDYQNITPELVYIIGVMMGDGYFLNNGIGLETKDKDFAEEFARCCEIQFGRESKFYNRERESRKFPDGKFYQPKPTIQVHFFSIDIRKFIEEIQNENWVRNLSIDLKILWLRGFWDSEGSITLTRGYLQNRLNVRNKKLIYLYKDLMDEVLDMNKEVHLQSDGKYHYYFYSLHQHKKFYEIVQPTIQRKRLIFESVLYK